MTTTRAGCRMQAGIGSAICLPTIEQVKPGERTQPGRLCSSDREHYESAIDCCISRGQYKAAVRKILCMQVKRLGPSAVHLSFLREAVARLTPREYARMRADVRAWAALARPPVEDAIVRTVWRR